MKNNSNLALPETMAGIRQDLFPSDLEQDDKENIACIRKISQSWKSLHPDFITDAMSDLGCPFSIRRVICQKCPEINTLASGYDSKNRRIVMCSEKVSRIRQEYVDLALSHALIHAYDDCRANVDWNNVEHLACSEVRATMLSMECTRKLQKKRGFHAYKTGDIEHCIKSHTFAGLKMMGIGEPAARRIIEKVYTPCFNDTAPYERPPP